MNIFRVMRICSEDSSQPRTGRGRKDLGVRAKGYWSKSENYDIVPDDTNSVSPISGGMSVFKNIDSMIEYLPHSCLPIELNDLYPDKIRGAARTKGSNIWMYCVVNEAHFDSLEIENTCEINNNICLRKDKPHHALIEPQKRMSYESYEEALYQTKSDWVAQIDKGEEL